MRSHKELGLVSQQRSTLFHWVLGWGLRLDQYFSSQTQLSNIKRSAPLYRNV